MIDIKLNYRIKYFKPRYKNQPYKIQFQVKTSSINKKYDDTRFFYQLSNWCAENIKNKFVVSRYTTMFTIVVYSIKDRDIVNNFWSNPKRKIRENIYTSYLSK